MKVSEASVGGSAPADSTQIDVPLNAAVEWLERQQSNEGYWVGMDESNSTIEAEWLIASHILGVRLPDEAGVVRALLQRQRNDGSWDIYPGAPDGDINATVEVYAALRLKGHTIDAEHMAKAREWILARGGLRDVRVFTRYWLAMIGVWPWRHTPNLPPEIIRLPRWVPFNIYNFAQWARATLVPLAVISARRPVWPAREAGRLEELFPEGIENFDFAIPAKQARPLSLDWLFMQIDGALHFAQSWGLTPMREDAIRLCLEWMLRHQDADGAWGGIQPPWIYGVLALYNEGYDLAHPSVAKGLNALEAHWTYERDGATHIQCTESPVWDTLFSLLAMHEAGVHLDDSPAMRKALAWILDHQVTTRGDWAVKVPDAPPGGWAFERANLAYPDVDDTALALLVLAKLRDQAGKLRPRVEAALQRGVAWTLAMQCRNGGWAAFDKDNDKAIISKIPFCNFGEALDPPSVDVTAHVLEALGELGYDQNHPAVARAVAYIKREQEADGSWFGRWGVNHIYGTAAVLPGLAAVGEDMSEWRYQRAAEWIQSKQNPDGGWGESCASYMDPAQRGVGDSTPSQTAWALMTLFAAGRGVDHPTVQRGVEHLAATQTDEGTWHEHTHTATGFPGYGAGERIDLDDPSLPERLQQGTELSRGFMLSFNMYRHYFPVIALARAKLA